MSFVIVGQVFASVFEVISFIIGIIQRACFQLFQNLLPCMDFDHGLTDVAELVNCKWHYIDVD